MILERPEAFCQGEETVEVTAAAVSELVDQLLGTRRAVDVGKDNRSVAPSSPVPACSCGSRIPLRRLKVTGEEI